MSFKNVVSSTWSMTRMGNLLMICFIMYLVRYSIIIPILSYTGLQPSLGNYHFALTVIGTMLIACGGYIINDFFDTGIDKINKPGKNVIGEQISKRAAKYIYGCITFTGVICSFLVAIKIKNNLPVSIILFSAVLLYLYSAFLKKTILIGNLIIALLSSAALWMCVFFDDNVRNSQEVVTIVSAYSLFAFLLTFARELIKDCEDIVGDKAFGSKTFPIVAGEKITRLLAGTIILVIIAGIIWIQMIQEQWQYKLSFGYVVLFVEIPLMFLLIKIITATTKKQDHFNSQLSKLIMLTGVLSMVIFNIDFH